MRPSPHAESDYVRFLEITTRWMDNDAYGHINNVVYYSFFDTAVNSALIEGGVLDIAGGAVIGLVAETQCQYFRPLAFPERIRAGVRVAHIGTSSIRYEVAIFGGDRADAAAQGHFVHVYVDRATGRPCPLPQELRKFAEGLRSADI